MPEQDNVLQTAFPGESEETERQARIVAFSLNASRRVKRAAVRTKDVTWMGMKWVGRGIAAAIPYIMLAGIAALSIAAVAASIWVVLSFFNWLYLTSPTAYYVIIGGVLLQAVGAVAYKKWATRKAARNTAEVLMGAPA